MRPFPASLPLGLLAALAAVPASAADDAHLEVGDCDVHSDYAMRTQGKAFVFSREDGAGPHEVALGGGRIWLDGEELEVSAADHRRLRTFERELGEALPEVRAIAVEATDIAFTALGEVARGFGASDDLAQKLDVGRERIRARLDEAATWFGPDGITVDDADARALASGFIEPVMTEFLPQLIGTAVRESLAMALSGDAAASADFEARMERMGKEIEARVEDRAEALEPMADALCERARRMEAVQSELELRTADGAPLRLFTVD
ncbi:DUF2884 family protein [Coralloluteibacterium stylophorae]|uniref:DUF2884 family protein n=1 Tax=Coralloluteibacterium stylophorae TaxID=1776034 RepID=A0A8J7VSH6_9GAMM|nr:DUF2884 family protein [Coralloluteibacterium stylophorae]MBS7457999.1 DUF2884 family protein [Coralloluteibacterium stylophorae]